MCLHPVFFSFVLHSLLVLKDPMVSSCTRPQSDPANSLRFLLISSTVEKNNNNKENCIHYAGLLNVL